MIRLEGSRVYARTVAMRAPDGYLYAPPGYGIAEGRVMQGPGVDSNTTVYLLEGDPGAWFERLVTEAQGTVTRKED